MQEIIQYIREDRKPVGVMVAIRNESGVRIGWSKCNRKDVFSKSLGWKIAIGRAEYGCQTPIPRNVQQQLKEFKSRAERYFKTKID